MTDLELNLSIFLLTNLFVVLLWVSRGPTIADQMLAALLFSTVGVALLLLLAYTQKILALIDTVLVFTLLACIIGVIFTLRVWQQGEKKDGSSR